MAADGFQSGAFQHTVKTPALFAGVGVHTGEYTQVAVRAAGTDAGIIFVRTDITDRDNCVPATPESVCKTQLGTVITNDAGVTVSTIEHLMAALVMMGIDNAVVELRRPGNADHGRLVLAVPEDPRSAPAAGPRPRPASSSRSSTPSRWSMATSAPR